MFAQKSCRWSASVWLVVLAVGFLSCGSEESESTPDSGTPQCEEGMTSCAGTCVDLVADPDNCGACGLVCNSSEVCSKGQCSLACQTGFTACERACVNLRNDIAHCGECGEACQPGEVCSDGQCALSCEEHMTDCDGSCVNTEKDGDHCGGCDRHCPTGQVCSGGACALTCQLGSSSTVVGLAKTCERAGTTAEPAASLATQEWSALRASVGFPARPTSPNAVVCA